MKNIKIGFALGVATLLMGSVYSATYYSQLTQEYGDTRSPLTSLSGVPGYWNTAEDGTGEAAAYTTAEDDYVVRHRLLTPTAWEYATFTSKSITMEGGEICLKNFKDANVTLPNLRVENGQSGIISCGYNYVTNAIKGAIFLDTGSLLKFYFAQANDVRWLTLYSTVTGEGTLGCYAAGNYSGEMRIAEDALNNFKGILLCTAVGSTPHIYLDGLPADPDTTLENGITLSNKVQCAVMKSGTLGATRGLWVPDDSEVKLVIGPDVELEMQGAWSGAGKITIAGAGKLILKGASPKFTGTIEIADARVVIPDGVETIFPNATAVTGTLADESQTEYTVAGLSYKGDVITAKNYACDGLVFQLDGIENAGYGKHDCNPTQWKDLVGANNITLPSWVTIKGNGFYSDVIRGKSGSGTIDNSKIDNPAYFTTIEGIDNSTPAVTLEVVSKRGTWIYKDNEWNLQQVFGTPRGGFGYRQHRDNGYDIVYPISSTETQIHDWTPLKFNAYNPHTFAFTFEIGNNAYWFDYTKGIDFTKMYKGNWGSKYYLFANVRADLIVYAVRVYNRKLSDAEIVAHQRMDRARFLGDSLTTPVVYIKDISTQKWDGANDVKPAITVHDYLLGKDLVSGVDYYLDWSNVDKPGTGKVTATGIGNYSGINCSATFNIERGFVVNVKPNELGELLADVEFMPVDFARTLYAACGEIDASSFETNVWDSVVAVAEVPANVKELKDVRLPVTGAKMRLFMAAEVGSQSYVQAGLMQQLDGEDNAFVDGVKGHNNETKVWADITGNGNDVDLPDFITVKEKSIVSNVLTDPDSGKCGSKTGLIPIYKSLNGLPSDISELTCEVMSKRTWVFIDNYENMQTLFSTPLGYICYRNYGNYQNDNKNVGDRGFGYLKATSVWHNGAKSWQYLADYYSYTHPTFNASDMHTLQARLANDNSAFHIDADSSAVSWGRYVDTWSSLESCVISKQYSYFNNPRATIEASALRLYNRTLTLVELQRNKNVDAVRYLGEGTFWAASDVIDVDVAMQAKPRGNGVVCLKVPASQYERLVYVAWGDTDGGETTNGWANVIFGGEIPAGVTSADGITIGNATFAKASRIFLIDKYDSYCYVKDGLLFQLDGIDNAVEDGVRKHVSNITTWADLTGNVVDGVALPNHVTVEDYGVYCAGALDITRTYFDIPGVSANKTITVEVVAQCVKWVASDDYYNLQEIIGTPCGSVGYRGNSNYQMYCMYPPYENSVRIHNFYNTPFDVSKLNSFAVVFDLKESAWWFGDTRYLVSNNDGYTLSNYEQSDMFGTPRSDIRISAVRIYNRILTPEEIVFNRTRDLVRFKGQVPTFTASVLLDLRAKGSVIIFR